MGLLYISAWSKKPHYSRILLTQKLKFHGPASAENSVKLSKILLCIKRPRVGQNKALHAIPVPAVLTV